MRVGWAPDPLALPCRDPVRLALDPITTLLLAIGLAMDSFSVSICTGTGVDESRATAALRVGLVMGGFQAAMPVAGWLGGAALASHVASCDHWIAFGLLLAIGLRMIHEALTGAGEGTFLDATRWRVLLALGVATSIDALAVGVSYACLGSAILVPVLVIGAVTFGLSFAGVFLGCHAGELLRGRVPIFGGLLLIGIGVRILVEHLGPVAAGG